MNTKCEILRKVVLCAQFFSLHLEPGTFPYGEIKGPFSLYWTCHCVWEYLSQFQTQRVLLCPAWARVACGTWPIPLLYLSPAEGRPGSSEWAQKESTLPWFGCQEGPAGHGTCWHTLLTLILLCLFYGSKALFHPVLNWCFLCGNSDTKISGQKCLDLYSDNRQRMPVAKHKIIIKKKQENLRK